MPRLAPLVLLAFASASLVPAAGAQPSADADAKEIAAYRLTGRTLTQVVNVNRTLMQQLSQDPRMQEARKIEAEISTLERKEQMSDADQKRLEELRTRQDQLDDSVENPLGGDTRTLSEMEARIKAYPPLLQALQQEGIAPREYAKFWLVFIQAAFAQGFKKSGMLKELPPGVSPENVKFIEDHAAEIEAMQKEFEALSRPK
jgi:septal ring factor EnvC (AmiA/AmiB activator)